jgi:hypothetical protein
MRIFIPLAALSPLILLASVGTPASAAVTHRAAAARAAMPEACAAYYPTNEFGGLISHGTTAGSELYAVQGNTEEWCRVVDGVPAGEELLRLVDSSYCAEYSGPAGGGPSGEVILADCDSGRTAQRWYETGTAPEIVYNVDVGGDACLSSDKGTDEYVYLVAPSGGCNGDGGQGWNDFPAP